MGVVVVGVDGSDRSVPALEWAGNEAAAHGHTLRVVTAWSIPVTALSPGGLPASQAAASTAPASSPTSSSRKRNKGGSGAKAAKEAASADEEWMDS